MDRGWRHNCGIGLRRLPTRQRECRRTAPQAAVGIDITETAVRLSASLCDAGALRGVKLNRMKFCRL